jgi:hypothetical protein
MTSQSLSSGTAVAAIGERLLGRVEELTTVLTAAIRKAEPSYDADNLVPADDLHASVRANLVYILTRLAGERMPPDLAPARATGRRRAEQGAPLPAILHSYRVAGTFLWATLLDEASPTDRAEALLPGAAQLWSLIDELSGAVTDAYRDAVAERARSNEQTRNAMLDVLLRGDAGDGSRLWESAATLRLPHHGTFVVAAARAPRPGSEAIAHAEDTLRARGIQSAWRVEIDAHVGVLVLTPRLGIDKVSAHLAKLSGGPVGLSEPYESLEQTPAALRQARLAGTAGPGEPGVVRYGDVPIAVLLASAPDAAGTVARSILGPVLALPAVECDVLLGTLRTWFAEDGATSVAAAKMHVHRNTVRYRLRRLEELTGRNLTSPTGVAELHLALEAARILRLSA